MNLDGRRVLVTGAAGGIGRALVTRLLQHGAHVLVTGRHRASLQRLAEQFTASGDRVQCCEADLAQPADRARLCDVATNWHGGIDILINNAGVSDFGLLADCTADDVASSLAVNALAPIELCRQLLPHLQTRRQAHIVNIGSVFGSIGYAGNSVYCASKFAIRGFSEALRRELADTNVRVHYFAPRATRTAINPATVVELNLALGNAVDEPAAVARQLIDLLLKDRAHAVIGWPEKFFARLNALFPGLVDAALRKQLPLIRRYATDARTLRPVMVTERARRVG